MDLWGYRNHAAGRTQEANHNCQKVWSCKGITWLFYLTEVVITCVVVDDEAENKIQGKS